MQPIGPFCGAGSLEAWRCLGRLSAAVLRRMAIRWMLLWPSKHVNSGVVELVVETQLAAVRH